VSLQQKGAPLVQSRKQKFRRAIDFVRFWYPLKFDFCRLTLAELKSMITALTRDDRKNPETYKPVVLIGHTKDLMDLETIDSFLAYLHEKAIPVSTFRSAIGKCGHFGPTAVSETASQQC
jgi:hypothetical protein